MNTQFVYLLTNPALPDFVKVGKTKNLKERIKELSCSTSIPLWFECYAYLEVPSDLVSNIETALHHTLGTAYDKAKEFFKTSPELAFKAFQDVVLINPQCVLHLIDDETAEPVETIPCTSIRPRTTFELLGLPVGTELVYCEDPKIKCTVADNKNQVLYDNKKTTLSHIACELKQFNVNGFDYFSFENETLFDRRLRLEKKEDGGVVRPQMEKEI